jgi:hypothetical protein
MEVAELVRKNFNKGYWIKKISTESDNKVLFPDSPIELQRIITQHI